MIKLAVFDLAGTTVYDEGGIVTNNLQRALTDFGFDVDWHAINATMGIPKKVAIAQLVPSAEPAQVDEIHERFREYILDFYRTNPSVKEIDGISELFQRLQDSGVLVGLDTGFDRETTDVVLSRMPWNGLYQASAASDEVERGRPNPDLLYRIMNQVGVKEVAEVAKIGDTPSDLGEGTSAGAKYVVGVTYGSHRRDQLEDLPHTHLVDTVAELYPILVGKMNA